jgi:hypothetical protein
VTNQVEISEEGLLFKYMSAERALTCLPEIGDGALRATQPAALNDPFECTKTKIFVEKDPEAGNRKLAQTLTEIQPRNPVTAEQVEEARVRHGSLYMGELYRQQLSTRFGIVSFSTDPFHPLLWSHYTQDGSGFAIGYKVEVLKSLTTAGVQLQPIQYIPKPGIVIDYKVLSTPESNVINPMRFKSDHWSYESEWRLIVELDLTVGTGERDRHGQPVNLFRVPNAAVGAVYYTERTPKRIVSQINGRLQAPNNRYGVRKAKKLVLAEDAYRYEEEGAAQTGGAVGDPECGFESP